MKFCQTSGLMMPHGSDGFLVTPHTGVVRARLHQASASTLQQLCDDASNSALIEINGDA